jgi:hypothetical protein
VFVPCSCAAVDDTDVVSDATNARGASSLSAASPDRGIPNIIDPPDYEGHVGQGADASLDSDIGAIVVSGSGSAFAEGSQGIGLTPCFWNVHDDVEASFSHSFAVLSPTPASFSAEVFAGTFLADGSARVSLEGPEGEVAGVAMGGGMPEEPLGTEWSGTLAPGTYTLSASAHGTGSYDDFLLENTQGGGDYSFELTLAPALPAASSGGRAALAAVILLLGLGALAPRAPGLRRGPRPG